MRASCLYGFLRRALSTGLVAGSEHGDKGVFATPLPTDFFEHATLRHALGSWDDTCILLLKDIGELEAVGADPLLVARSRLMRSDLHLKALFLLFTRYQWATQTIEQVKRLNVLDETKSRLLAIGYVMSFPLPHPAQSLLFM